MSQCFHCGEENPPSGAFEGVFEGRRRSFCCPGCLAVFSAIQDAGLGGYYRFRSENAVKAEPAEDWSFVEQPAFQEQFVDTDSDGSHKVWLTLEGVRCAACGWLIEKHLVTLDGVLAANLNVTNHRLQLHWREPARLSQCLAALQSIGYRPRFQAPSNRQQEQQYHRQLIRVGVAGILTMQVMMVSLPLHTELGDDLSATMREVLRWVAALLVSPIVFYSARPFIKGGLQALKVSVLTMDVPVSLAIVLVYGAGWWAIFQQQGDVYFDSLAMFVFLLLTGRFFEQRLMNKAREALNPDQGLPVSCRCLRDQQWQTIPVADVRVGDRIQIPAGQAVPVDGRVMQGESAVNEAWLTGEPRLRQVGESAAVWAGTLNVEQPLVLAVGAVGQHTRFAAVQRLQEQAQSEKPPLVKLAQRFAHRFLLVVFVAITLAGIGWLWMDPSRAFWVVTAMLVAACPCALSLAVPTVVATAVLRLRQQGVLITRGHVIEGLPRIDTVIFDKTGTLTEGRPRLLETVTLADVSRQDCIAIASALEMSSAHPLARAFPVTGRGADHVRQIAGAGLQGDLVGKTYRLGSRAFVSEWVTVPGLPDDGQWLVLADRMRVLAFFSIADSVRESVVDVVNELRDRGLSLMLLSGDHSGTVVRVAADLNIADNRGGLLPEDKVDIVKGLQQQGRRVLMVGDGFNDAPVLALADIAMAMDHGADISKLQADGVLLNDDLRGLCRSMQTAVRGRRILFQNLVWAGAYNVVMLPLAGFGLITPAWAALGMSLSSLGVLLNGLRLLKK